MVNTLFLRKVMRIGFIVVSAILLFAISLLAGDGIWTVGSAGLEGITLLKCDVHNPQTLYAIRTDNEACIPGIYKSTDGGKNWAVINTGVGEGYQDGLFFALEIDQNNPNVLWASGT